MHVIIYPIPLALKKPSLRLSTHPDHVKDFGLKKYVVKYEFFKEKMNLFSSRIWLQMYLEPMVWTFFPLQFGYKCASNQWFGRSCGSIELYVRPCIDLFTPPFLLKKNKKNKKNLWAFILVGPTAMWGPSTTQKYAITFTSLRMMIGNDIWDDSIQHQTRLFLANTSSERDESGTTSK